MIILKLVTFNYKGTCSENNVHVTNVDAYDSSIEKIRPDERDVRAIRENYINIVDSFRTFHLILKHLQPSSGGVRL